MGLTPCDCFIPGIKVRGIRNSPTTANSTHAPFPRFVLSVLTPEILVVEEELRVSGANRCNSFLDARIRSTKYFVLDSRGSLVGNRYPVTLAIPLEDGLALFVAFFLNKCIENCSHGLMCWAFNFYFNGKINQNLIKMKIFLTKI